MLPWTFNDMIKAGISYFRIKRFLNEKEIDLTKGKLINHPESYCIIKLISLFINLFNSYCEHK